MAVGGGDGGSGGLRQGRRGRRSRSSSPEVTSRPPCTLAGRGGRCRSSSLCEICKFKQVASSCEDGGGDGSESLGSDSNTIESSDDSSQRMPLDSVSEVPEGVTDLAWGGVDGKTCLTCRHGKTPSRFVCWQGKHTGRRYLGCPVEDQKMKCRFVKWKDPQWSNKVQSILLTLWDIVGRFEKEAETAQVGLLGAIVQKKEFTEEKEAWDKEKAILQRNALLLWLTVFCMVAVVMAIVLGLVLKAYLPLRYVRCSDN